MDGGSVGVGDGVVVGVGGCGSCGGGGGGVGDVDVGGVTPLLAITVQSPTTRYAAPQNPAGFSQVMRAPNVADDQVSVEVIHVFSLRVRWTRSWATSTCQEERWAARGPCTPLSGCRGKSARKGKAGGTEAADEEL